MGITGISHNFPLNNLQKSHFGPVEQLFQVLPDREIVEAFLPILGSKFRDVRLLESGEIEILLEEEIVHYLKADRRFQLPLNTDIVVPERLVLSYDSCERKVKFLSERTIEVKLRFGWLGRWHVANVREISVTDEFEGNERWLRTTGEIRLPQVLKKILPGLGADRRDAWVTVSRVRALFLNDQS